MYKVLYIDHKGKCDEIFLGKQDYELVKLASNIQILNVNKLEVRK